MQKCTELSRLPRAGVPSSVNFKRTTPGLIGPALFYGNFNGRLQRIDPNHPASQYKPTNMRKFMPSSKQPGFLLRAFPKGSLFKPENAWPDPPFHLAEPSEHKVNMSLVTVMNHEMMFKHVVYRRRMKTRIKEAANLIVIRGAYVGRDAEGKEAILFSNEPQRDLVLEDWTYVMSPELTMFRMPWIDVILGLRVALKEIRDQGRQLEVQWNLEAEKRQNLPAAQSSTDSRPARYANRSAVATRRTRPGPPQHAAAGAELTRTPSSTSPHTPRSVRSELPEGEASLKKVSNQAENVMAQLRKALPSELLQEDPYLLSDLDFAAEFDFDNLPNEKPLGRRSTERGMSDEGANSLDWRTLAAAASEDIDVDLEAATKPRQRRAGKGWEERFAEDRQPSRWTSKPSTTGLDEQGNDKRAGLYSKLLQGALDAAPRSDETSTRKKPDVLQSLWKQKRVLKPGDERKR